MGIDLICGEISFCSSYSDWSEIRTNILKATFDYIQDKYEKDKELYGNLTQDDENWIGEGSSYYCYIKKLLELKTYLLQQQNTKMENLLFPTTRTIGLFIQLSSKISILNALNCFDIGGLFALCNQSDCEGYYTSGNSLDICCLFDRIEPFLKKYDCYACIYIQEGRAFNRLYDVFEQSYKTLSKVTIA